jgi:hypothetical protein
LARDARRSWEETGRIAPLFLVISHNAPAGVIRVEVQQGGAKGDRDAELSIVINLGQVFADADRSLSKTEPLELVAR